MKLIKLLAAFFLGVVAIAAILMAIYRYADMLMAPFNALKQKYAGAIRCCSDDAGCDCGSHENA